MSIAEIVESVVDGPAAPAPRAYDGSALGPPDAAARPAPAHAARGGLPRDRARATSGWPGPTSPATSTVEGVHPGDPYDLLVDLADVRFRRPSAGGRDRGRPHARASRGSRRRRRRRRRACRAGAGSPRGCGHSMTRDAEAIQPPLRRLQPVLRARPRPVDDLHVRLLPRRRRDPRAGPGQQVPPRVRQARPAAGRPAARHRLRLGRHGAVRRAARRARHWASPCRASRRCGRRRRSPTRGWPTSPRCGTATTATSPRPGSTPSRRSGSPSTSGCATTRPTSAGSRTGCAPAGCCSTTASPARTTGARRPAPSSTATSSPTASSPASGGSSPTPRTSGSRCVHEENLREHYARTLAAVVPQPRRALGRVRRRGGRGHRPGLGPLHGRLATRVRAQRDPAAPGAGGQARTTTASPGLPLRPWWQRLSARRSGRRSGPRGRRLGDGADRPSQSSAVRSSASSSLLWPPAAPPAASQASAVARTMPTSGHPPQARCRRGSVGEADPAHEVGDVAGDAVGHPGRDVALRPLAGGHERRVDDEPVDLGVVLDEVEVGGDDARGRRRARRPSAGSPAARVRPRMIVASTRSATAV